MLVIMEAPIVRSHTWASQARMIHQGLLKKFRLDGLGNVGAS